MFIITFHIHITKINNTTTLTDDFPYWGEITPWVVLDCMWWRSPAAKTKEFSAHDVKILSLIANGIVQTPTS